MKKAIKEIKALYKTLSGKTAKWKIELWGMVQTSKLFFGHSVC